MSEKTWTEKRRRPPKGEAWIWTTIMMLKSQAWKRMTRVDRRLIDFLAVEYAEHAGRTNGRLMAPDRQLREFGIGANATHEAIIHCQELGLIRAEQVQGRSGGRAAWIFQLTFYPDAKGNPATNDWKKIGPKEPKPKSGFLLSKTRATRPRKRGQPTARGSMQETQVPQESADSASDRLPSETRAPSRVCLGGGAEPAASSSTPPQPGGDAEPRERRGAARRRNAPGQDRPLASPASQPSPSTKAKAPKPRPVPARAAVGVNRKGSSTALISSDAEAPEGTVDFMLCRLGCKLVAPRLRRKAEIVMDKAVACDLDVIACIDRLGFETLAMPRQVEDRLRRLHRMILKTNQATKRMKQRQQRPLKPLDQISRQARWERKKKVEQRQATGGK